MRTIYVDPGGLSRRFLVAHATKHSKNHPRKQADPSLNRNEGSSLAKKSIFD
jgi:hypothetical protein